MYAYIIFWTEQGWDAGSGICGIFLDEDFAVEYTQMLILRNHLESKALCEYDRLAEMDLPMTKEERYLDFYIDSVPLPFTSEPLGYSFTENPLYRCTFETDYKLEKVLD